MWFLMEQTPDVTLVVNKAFWKQGKQTSVFIYWLQKYSKIFSWVNEEILFGKYWGKSSLGKKREFIHAHIFKKICTMYMQHLFNFLYSSANHPAIEHLMDI